MLQSTIVMRSSDSVKKTQEGAWDRVKREFRPGLTSGAFMIVATLIVAATGTYAVTIAPATTRAAAVAYAVGGAAAGLFLSAALMALALVLKAPYWQRDEARNERNVLQKQLDGRIPESAIRRDATLFVQFLEYLPSDRGAIPYLKDHDFAARFFYRYIDPLRDFALGWNNAEHEFLTPQVEEKRKILLERIDHFYGLVAAHTFTVEHEKGLEREEKRGEVPRELEEKDTAKYNSIVNALNDAADQLAEAHQDLVREGRHRLPGDAS